MKNRFKKLFLSRISVNFVSHCFLPSFTVNLSLFTLLILTMLFLVFSARMAMDIMTNADYYITKADNKIMKMKINYLMAKAKESFDYLEMSRKTESQIRKIIGLDKDFYKNNYFISAGGPEPQDIENLKKMLAKKVDEINGKNIDKVFDVVKKKSKERLSGYEEITWYITNKYNLSRALPKGWPAAGNISSPFGYRIHPLSLSYEYHSGIDISNLPGTKISATADGTVRWTGWASGYGLTAIIDHGFGFSTLYAHMSEISVKEGMTVRRGDEVGKMGSTGTSTGPHLHYEVWENGVPKNPMKYINPTHNNDFSVYFGDILKLN